MPLPVALTVADPTAGGFPSRWHVPEWWVASQVADKGSGTLVCGFLGRALGARCCSQHRLRPAVLIPPWPGCRPRSCRARLSGLLGPVGDSVRFLHVKRRAPGCRKCVFHVGCSREQPCPHASLPSGVLSELWLGSDAEVTGRGALVPGQPGGSAPPAASVG